MHEHTFSVSVYLLTGIRSFSCCSFYKQFYDDMVLFRDSVFDKLLKVSFPDHMLALFLTFGATFIHNHYLLTVVQFTTYYRTDIMGCPCIFRDKVYFLLLDGMNWIYLRLSHLWCCLILLS